MSSVKIRPSLTRLLPSLLFGFGAGISFLIAYLAAPVPDDERIFVGTGVFMVAAVGLMLAYRIAKQKLWPLPWSTLLIVAMGGLTLWLHDEVFIKVRPTLQFAAVATIAAAALATRHPRLEAAFPSDRFDAAGRRKIILMLIGFGIAMALLNELVWRNSSDLFWIGYQIWGPIVGFAFFAAASIPTMNRHWIGQCKARTSE